MQAPLGINWDIQPIDPLVAHWFVELITDEDLDWINRFYQNTYKYGPPEKLLQFVGEVDEDINHLDYRYTRESLLADLPRDARHRPSGTGRNYSYCDGRRQFPLTLSDFIYEKYDEAVAKAALGSVEG